MQYLGGKSMIRIEVSDYLKELRAKMEAERGEKVPYWEPFVGSGWVLQEMDEGETYASDVNGALISLWRKLQNGWEPPETVTKEMYYLAKGGKMTAHETAFIGFACSYRGIWFGGYAQGEGKNYAKTGRDSLLRKIEKINALGNVTFFTANFLRCYVPAQGCLIYCDVPYEGTEGFKGAPKWRPDLFWKRVRQLEKWGHKVVVSEYAAPYDFTAVLEMKSRMQIGNNKNKLKSKKARMERLFRYTKGIEDG